VGTHIAPTICPQLQITPVNSADVFLQLNGNPAGLPGPRNRFESDWGTQLVLRVYVPSTPAALHLPERPT